MKIVSSSLLCIVMMVMMVVMGCDDFLSHEPDNRTQLNTEEKVAELLVSAYPEANYITFCEAMTDNVSVHLGGVAENENTNPFFWEDVDANEQDSPQFYWDACYNAIAACNYALEAIENADDPSRYDAQKGEALVARAYAHFMLVNLFAKMYDESTSDTDPGIPYVDKPETIAIGQYERRTVEYVYQRIEIDLEDGLELISDESYTVPKYHFTQSAAHAFAVRYYLYKRAYDHVITHANAVFTDNDFASRLRPWNTTYQELAFDELEATYTRSTQPANLLLCETSSLWARRYNSYRYATGIDELSDARSIAGIVGGNFAYTVYIITSIDTYFIVKFREHFVQEDISADIGLPYTIVPLFTAEEVLLSRAEAYSLKGTSTVSKAVDDLNTFLSTRIADYDASEHTLTSSQAATYYGLSDNSSNRQLAIWYTTLLFRRVEFLHEGLWWFDLVRNGFDVTHVDANGAEYVLEPDDPRRVLQIPPQAISQAGLEANPR